LVQDIYRSRPEFPVAKPETDRIDPPTIGIETDPEMPAARTHSPHIEWQRSVC